MADDVGRRAGAMERLDPENRRRVERLLRERPRRLAVLNQHQSSWPRTFAQVAPMTAAMDAELREEIMGEERKRMGQHDDALYRRYEQAMEGLAVTTPPGGYTPDPVAESEELRRQQQRAHHIVMDSQQREIVGLRTALAAAERRCAALSEAATALVAAWGNDEGELEEWSPEGVMAAMGRLRALLRDDAAPGAVPGAGEDR